MRPPCSYNVRLWGEFALQHDTISIVRIHGQRPYMRSRIGIVSCCWLAILDIEPPLGHDYLVGPEWRLSVGAEPGPERGIRGTRGSRGA